MNRSGCEDCDFVPRMSPKLIIDAEEEHRGDAVQMFQRLTAAGHSPDYLRFTAEEAAQFHDQPGALAICGERIFDRIDDAMYSADSWDLMGEQGGDVKNDAAGATANTALAASWCGVCIALTMITGL